MRNGPLGAGELYHEAGDDKKCIRECDEIILWFGHGEYVDLANALKAEVNGGRGAGDLGPDMQQTVGATYMFDSEGLLERSGLNVPLNVDEYMQDDDEYSDVYDLEEGGQTEAMAAAAKTKTEEDILAAAAAQSSVPDKKAIAEELKVTVQELKAAVQEPEEKPTDMGATMVLDSAVIAAKAAAILAGKDEYEEDDEIISEDSPAVKEQDFIARIQRNVENSRPAGHPAVKEDFSSRQRMVTPEVLPEKQKRMKLLKTNWTRRPWIYSLEESRERKLNR